jgi:hypothetical protein
MLSTIALKTSFTLIPPPPSKPSARPLIVDDVALGDHDQHLVLPTGDFADALRKLAMEELKPTQIRVGSKEANYPVEFFVLDLKRDKVAVAKLKKIVTRHWRRVVNNFEIARDETGDIFSDTLSGAANEIEEWITLRRFLSNALNPELIRKSKRSVLLFHHEDANAPELSNERYAA